MRNAFGFLAVAGLAVAAAPMLATPSAVAAEITYTETDTASGSLDGVAFTDASIVLRMTNDTTNITSVVFPPLVYLNNGTATVSIGGGAPVTFLDSINVFSTPSLNAVGFEDQVPFSCPGCGSDILDDISVSFATYQLDTSIGPITGTAQGNPGEAFATTGGDLILDSFGDPTFTATLVPEPASALLLVSTLTGFLLARRPRRKWQALLIRRRWCCCRA